MLIYVSWRCWVFLCRGRHGKNTLAGVNEKFEHTLFNFVQMSSKIICKVLTVQFSIYIIKNYIIPVVSTNLIFFEILITSANNYFIKTTRPQGHASSCKCQKKISSCQIFFLALLEIDYFQHRYFSHFTSLHATKKILHQNLGYFAFLAVYLILRHTLALWAVPSHSRQPPNFPQPLNFPRNSRKTFNTFSRKFNKIITNLQVFIAFSSKF